MKTPEEIQKAIELLRISDEVAARDGEPPEASKVASVIEHTLLWVVSNDAPIISRLLKQLEIHLRDDVPKSAD